jgi:Alpha-galactosidase
LTDQEKQAIKEHIKFYKENRQLLLHGKFQQLLDLNPDSNEVAFGVTDQNESYIGFSER